jgi:hypothetical protein
MPLRVMNELTCGNPMINELTSFHLNKSVNELTSPQILSAFITDHILNEQRLAGRFAIPNESPV